MRRGASGFTLVEILVSMVLLGIISSAIVGTLWTSITSWERSVAVASVLQKERALLERVSSELKSSFQAQNPGRTGLWSLDKRGGKMDRDELIFVTSAGGWPGHVIVRYRVDDDRETHRTGLMRGEIPLPGKLDRDEIEELLDESERLMVPGIIGLDATHFDGEEWVDEWDPEGIAAALPSAVRVVFTVARAEDEKEKDGIELPPLLVTLATKERT